MLPPPVPLMPLACFDNERCRQRGPFDRHHAILRNILGRWLAGAPNRPAPSHLHRWLTADKRNDAESFWCITALTEASADPFFCLRGLVREDAVSIFDIAQVVAENDSRVPALTEWLNQYGDWPADAEREMLSLSAMPNSGSV